MPTKTIERPQDIYQMKVTLLGTRPPIWRRLLIPSDLTLEQLHSVLQAAMGCEDGGPARRNSLTPERRAEIARKAAAARWAKRKS